ncbi:MAG: hypothetical protein JST91_06140 [Actinobacteria bacterium]|nr:hypothetical protein [Actinomycetota bacterium]
MKLDDSTLPGLAVATPTYDRGEIGIGIVHFGVGGLHRAHQAMYVDRLPQRGLTGGWGICGAGVLPADRRTADAMAVQDGQHTPLLQNPDGTRATREAPVGKEGPV